MQVLEIVQRGYKIRADTWPEGVYLAQNHFKLDTDLSSAAYSLMKEDEFVSDYTPTISDVLSHWKIIR